MKACRDSISKKHLVQLNTHVSVKGIWDSEPQFPIPTTIDDGKPLTGFNNEHSYPISSTLLEWESALIPYRPMGN